VSRPVEVIPLTQDDGAFGEVAKEILARLAGEYPLVVREVDLATAEGRGLATSAGVLPAPGVLLDGEPFSYLERRTSARDEQIQPR
jgi:hypothetical protein